MPTFEFDGKTTDLDNKPADYKDIAFVPKPEEPTIKAPAPVAKPSDTSSTGTRTRKPRADKADKARVKTEPPKPATPEVTAARKQKVSEALTIASGSLLLAGKARSSTALRADGHTIAAISEPFSEAVANVAAVDPYVARMLDHEGSAKAAAYVGLVSVAFSLGAQLAANHNLIKPGTMNTASAEQVIAALEPEEPTHDNETR